MPLSGSFNVRHSLSLQQRVKIIIVGSGSSFASNERRAQCFPLQTCELKGTHNIRVVRTKTKNSLYTVIKMSSHTDPSAVFAGNDYFINEISVILDKHRSKYYYVHNNDKKQ